MRQPKEAKTALVIAIRMRIATLAILAIPALGAVVVGLNQCKDPGCSARTSQVAQLGGR